MSYDDKPWLRSYDEGVRPEIKIPDISPLSTPSEMLYQLNDCNCKALVTLDAIFEHRLLTIADQLPHLIGAKPLSSGYRNFLFKSL